MMKCLARAFLIACVAAFAAIAQAAPITFFTTLTGPSENPPVASPGIGVAWVVFDVVAHTMRVVVDFENLLSPVSIAHIHCCVDPPGNVGVATPVPTFPGFPAGVTSGFYDETFDTLALSTYNPAFVTAQGGLVENAESALFAGLLAGRAYLNVHTQQFPMGEIRGFLQQLPEPATLVLLGIALVGAGLARRRR